MYKDCVHSGFKGVAESVKWLVDSVVWVSNNILPLGYTRIYY